MDEENQKWYQSRFAKQFAEYLGIATVLVGLGIGVGKCNEYISYGNAEEIRAQAETSTRLEYQRLRTIEEIVRAQGSRMTAEELRGILKENSLDGEGESPEYSEVVESFINGVKRNLQDLESPGE